MNTLTEIIEAKIRLQKIVVLRQLNILSDLKKVLKEYKSNPTNKEYLRFDNKYEAIISKCCNAYDITEEDLKLGSRKHPYPECITMIAYITGREGLNYYKMAGLVKRNHSTFSVAKGKALEYMQDSIDYRNKNFQKKFIEIMEKLK
jgi:hypothetical protein